MTTSLHDDFEDTSQLVSKISTHLVFGRLSLIVGSGISSNLKLPKWKQLIQNLYKNAGQPCPNNFSPDKLAQEFYGTHCGKNNLKFKKAVFAALYPSGLDLSIEKLHTDKNLLAIAALMASSIRGRISNVITFNFDNVLELYLHSMGIVTDSVYRPSQLANNVDVTIYHIHGYLPYADKLKSPFDGDENELILTRSDIVSRISNPSNLWRAQALSIMSRSFVVFGGLSGDDDNLFSLASQVKEVHTMSPYWGVALTTDSSEAGRWRDLNVFGHQLASHKEISTFLLQICQEAANISSSKL